MWSLSYKVSTISNDDAQVKGKGGAGDYRNNKKAPGSNL